MPDPTEPEIPAAPSDEPQAEVMMPEEGRGRMTKTTHEVDPSDMFQTTT